MGRKTYESIGKPLPGRKNIVISRSGFKADGVIVVDSIDAALDEVADADEAMVIGGANIYQQVIPVAQKMYLTLVNNEFKGDAWFPEYSMSEWEIKSETLHKSDEKNNYDFKICIFERVRH